jgi:tRNA uridine 5-carboxymethylaminomethyl modification enzyme
MAHHGHRIGLVSDGQLAAVEAKYAAVESERKRLEHTGVAPSSALSGFLSAHNEPDAPSGARLADLLRRPTITYDELAPFDPSRPELSPAVTQAVEIDTKYQGYIDRQLRQVAEMKKLEERLLPEDTDYNAISALRLEARQKLDKVRPRSLGQASRISGVSPADISVLMVWLSQQ